LLPSRQKLTLDLLAAITLEVVPFRAYALFPARLPFLNTSSKSCSVTDDSHVVFGQKLSGEKGSVMRQPVLLSPEFGAKSSHIFM
jgi:hypothetical protein